MRSIHTSIIDHAKNHGDKTAIVVDDKSYNWRVFVDDVTKAMHKLKKAPHRVIVNVGRDYHTYVTICAIFCLKKCFVPINTDFPQKRQQRMREIIKGNSNSNTNEACIYFTSGTTGTPKAAALSYDNLNAFFSHMQTLFAIDHNDRLSQFATLSFDIALFDLGMSWLTGASLHVIGKKEQMMPLAFLQKQNISVTFATPAVIHFMQKLGLNNKTLAHIRISIFAGEALSTDSAKAWLKACPNVTLYNFYGPVETTIDLIALNITNAYLQQESQAICAIGRPFPNTHAIIVDQDSKPVNPGQKGELIVTGPFVGLGYINHDSERFFAIDIQGQKQQAYKTGDLCYQDSKGLLHFCGRIDHQVKIHGQRVELEEIEHTIGQLIKKPVAIIYHQQRLIAYIEASAEITKATDLKSNLAKTLPGYMIPEQIHYTPLLKLNQNGKIDRKALLDALN